MTSDTVEIQDLDQFVRMLTAWHNSKVATLEHMLTVPEGTEMELPDGSHIELSENHLRGFKAGLVLALIELGSLPFVAEPMEAANESKH